VKQLVAATADLAARRIAGCCHVTHSVTCSILPTYSDEFDNGCKLLVVAGVRELT